MALFLFPMETVCFNPLGFSFVRSSPDSVSQMDSMLSMTKELAASHFFALQVLEGRILRKDGDCVDTLAPGLVMDMFSNSVFTFYYLCKQSHDECRL